MAPLQELLIFLDKTVAGGDLGVAIILLTVLVRLVLAPFFYKATKNQVLLQRLQPELRQIQQQHKDNREQQALAMMALYRRHQINPFSSFLLILLQLPILIALYRVFLNLPPQLESFAFDLLNLKETSIIVTGLAVVFQYFQGRLLLPPTADPTAKNMVWLGPVLTLVFLAYLPSAVGLYWLTTTLFSIGQQLYLNQQLKKDGTITTNNAKNPGAGRFL